MSGDHAHDHRALARAGDRRYLVAALGLIAGFMLVEAALAVVAGSLVLLADAGHMLIDAGALGMALWAGHLAERPAAAPMTYGLKRAEILSAAVNGVTLLVIGALILFEAIVRLAHPGSVRGGVVLGTAGVGIVVNVAATAVLSRAKRTRLNVAGAFAHLVTDLWAFLATLVAGAVIVLTGFDRADAIASLVVVVLMALAAWRLLRASGHILLEGAPEGVDLAEVRAHLLEVPEVTAVHDLHAWVLTSDLPALSAHIVVEGDCFANGEAPRVLDELQACVAGHFDVEHSTFQLEPAGHFDHESAQHD